MNAQNPDPTPVDIASKSRFRKPFAKSDSTHNAADKAKSVKDKAKSALTVVGVVALAGVVAGTVAKKRGVKGVVVDLPSTDVTHEAS